MTNIAIFASGTGSNAQKIIEHFKSHPDISVSLIVSNKVKAGVLDLAKAHNIPSFLLHRANFYNNEEILDIFYKLSHLSDSDSTFDYFYKLKTDIPNIMFKQNNRYKTPQSSKKRTNKERTAHWKNNPTQVFNVNKDGKIEVTF